MIDTLNKYNFSKDIEELNILINKLQSFKNMDLFHVHIKDLQNMYKSQNQWISNN